MDIQESTATHLFAACIGGLIAFIFMVGMVDAKTDEIARIRLQYQDCMMIGEYPTKADMGTEDTGQ